MDVKQPQLISHAFEELAQSLRILGEAHFRFGGLITVDRAEAVGNIETALSSVVNGFHSLYDAIAKQIKQSPINWYQTAELATILAIRNARHHNVANRIRTLYSYHAQESNRPTDMLQYVLVDFPSLDEDDADTFEVYLSWADFAYLLDLPKQTSRIHPNTCAIIKTYLKSDSFSGYAREFRLNESRVFFNVVPLIVNAALKVVPLVKSHILGDSTESTAFANIFSTVERLDTQNPEVNCGPFALPE